MGEAKRRDDAVKAGVKSGCGNCRFFLSQDSSKGQFGWCRRLPPAALLVGMMRNNITNEMQAKVDSFHPMIPATAWCGEWAPSGQPVLAIDEKALADGLATELANAETEGTA